jgi:hypothetical protein
MAFDLCTVPSYFGPQSKIAKPSSSQGLKNKFEVLIVDHIFSF